jgi:hypothetical protein
MGATAKEDGLRINFTLRRLDGMIDVSVTRNSDPVLLGYSLLSGGHPVGFAEGFPVCRGSVTYPADGYAAVFGWTQPVRSTDGAVGNFEMDPIVIYRDVATPFAWYGLARVVVSVDPAESTTTCRVAAWQRGPWPAGPAWIITSSA